MYRFALRSVAKTVGEAACSRASFGVSFPTCGANIRQFAFITFFLCCCLSARAQTPPADIKALLARIREHRAAAPNLQADFEEQRKIHLLDEPITSTGKVWFQAPNKFRLERKGNSPSVTVNDGQTMWIYYPKFKSAERYSLGKRSPLDAAIAAITTALNLQNVENSFHIAGKKAADGYDLELTPRNPSMKRIFQKLDPHLKAIAGEIEARLKQDYGVRATAIDGFPASQWIVLDYMQVIVHVFHQTKREFYALEDLWGDAPRLEWETAQQSPGFRS